MKFNRLLFMVCGAGAASFAAPALCFAEQRVPTSVAPDLDASLIRQPPNSEPADPLKKNQAQRSGLYFQLAAGSGLFFAATAEQNERRFRANTFSLLAAAGGTPSERLVVGGMLAADRALGLGGTDEQGGAIELEGVEFYMLTVGPFLELYPVPPHGLHFGIGAYVSDLNVHRRVNGRILEADDDPIGLSFSLAAGYEWRIGSKLHVGALARVLYAPLEVNETGTDVDVTVWIPALLLNATLH